MEDDGTDKRSRVEWTRPILSRLRGTLLTIAGREVDARTHGCVYCVAAGVLLCRSEMR